MRLHRYQLAYYGLWALVLLLAIPFVQFSAAAAVSPSHGFVAYYTAARLVREGVDANRFYDDAWFLEQTKQQGVAADDIYFNPPPAALILLPVAGLNYTDARIIWTVFNLVCLISVGGWFLWRAGLRGLFLPGYIAFALLYQPLFANFKYGQAYLLLTGLLVIAWYGFQYRREKMLGIALGLMLILKTAGVFLWLLLLVQRRWHALAWGIVTVLAIGLGSLPWLGINSWQTFFHLLPGLTSKPEMAVTAYQTLLSFFRHLFTYESQLNPAPLFPAPLLGTWLPWVGFVAMIAISTYQATVTNQPSLIFAVFILINLILSPLSLDYHFTLLLIPIALLTIWIRGEPSPWPGILLGIAVFMIGADLPYRSPRLVDGAWALLAYPKLYGSFLLWGLAVWACRQKSQASYAANGC
ncbi:MAG: DUF2029 domain-containing protein [Chloroflexi bacterium]|nr:DUF2029 domain-containing protein [Chloroflexota bacterium]